MKQIVLMAEGEGDATALPQLVKMLLTEHSLWSGFALSQRVFEIGSIGNLTGKPANQQNWLNKLTAAARESQNGAVLTVLDGDSDQCEGQDFCAFQVAALLADRGRSVGAGSTFSLAVVFAVQEYESWLLAAVPHLAGRDKDPNGTTLRSFVRADAVAPNGNLELAPRDAKAELKKLVSAGYKPTQDQFALTQMLDSEGFRQIRQRPMRGFRRLESAVRALAGALTNDAPHVSPRSPTP